MPVLFLVSGVFDTLCTQHLVYLGASSMRSMFSIFGYYFAQAIVGLSPIEFGDTPTNRKTSTDVEESHGLVDGEEVDTDAKLGFPEEENSHLVRYLYLASAILDISGYVIRTIGMVYCGSGLFQVAFSSVAIFSAIYSRVILKTFITPLQWFGIVVVTVGLVVSPFSSNTSGSSPITGILLTLLGAQFYAISYIVNEYIIRVPGNKGSKEICKQVGLINTFLCFIVICVDTIPNRDVLVYQPIAVKKATVRKVFEAMGMYIISHIIHSYALYSIQGSLGAIWTGLLQCIRACVVFLSSHYLYCSTDPNQCLTTSKIVSTILVCVGIFIFTMGKQSIQSVSLSSESSQ
ncbi:hypothetical protein WA171_003810 [Blastocystis sp. BT1]